MIVFAKATATAAVAAAATAAGAIGPSTLVLTLQNGLGNIEALLAHVPADRLLAGTTTLGTELLGPGHIRALGSGETVLGPLRTGRPLALPASHRPERPRRAAARRPGRNRRGRRIGDVTAAEGSRSRSTAPGSRSGPRPTRWR